MSVLSQVADRLSGGRLTEREFVKRFERYLADGQRVDGDGEALLEAFLKSGGTTLTKASHRAAAVSPTYDFGKAVDRLGLWSQEGSFESALSKLNKDGYAILDVRLPPEVVTELSGYFAAAPCTLTADDESKLLAPGETVTVDFENPRAEKYAVTTDSTMQNPTVRSLLLDRGLLEIAQAYCRSAPIIDIVIAWYSFPSTHASHQAAQLFHFDLDRIRWLKVFFLLTDQGPETGAHMYVPGTQADGGIDKDLLARGYARLEDDDVSAHHPRSGWRSMEGLSGVILLEDTRGLHKGATLLRDHRLMLQFEYTQSLFGHPAGIETAEMGPIDDPYWTTFNEEYPLVLKAFQR